MIRAAWLGLLLLLAACAGRSPAPIGEGGGRLSRDAFLAADGAVLPITRWQAADERALVLALHGFNDYRAAFAWSAPQLAARGLTVVAYDQRGFGETDMAGRWGGAPAMAADALAMAAALRAEAPDRPIYLMGVSMGAAVATVASAHPRAADLIEGTILVAPAAWGWSELNVFYQATLWTAARVAPGWRLTGRGLDRVPTDNREALILMGRDPHVIKATRVDAIEGLVDLMDLALDRAPHVRTPVLALHAGREEIVPKHAVEALLARLPQGAQSVHFPDAYHMMLRDHAREKVIARIADFVRPR